MTTSLYGRKSIWRKAKESQKDASVNDPYFNDIPWEIICDDQGRVVGEVFLNLHGQPLKSRENRWVHENTTYITLSWQ
ncbi:hypothetical protein [Paenibacillus sp. L3-i20]|uniref:hypothetical protein n=1 Tax=Paenibacillus sp. L3-i20 TaxID=2905833 RepID=UPI001EE10159|nr:hypothetical protein [Paenibacillus sp. L3-i20]